jgi:tetratricopeptide (TPR) repeat protein
VRIDLGWVLAGLTLAASVVLAVVLISGGEDSQPPQARSGDLAGKASGGGDGGAGRGSALPPPSESPDPTQGAQLNDEGYALIQQGRYEEAVPVLQEAVASFPEGETDLTYAYALFNLGQALRLSGRPEEAIPVLEERAKIPDQRATVLAELEMAREAAAK